LQIENAALSVVKPTFGNAIHHFGANDTIDLSGLRFANHASASYNSTTDLLKVTSGGITDTLKVTTTATNPVDGNFVVSADGHGGTEITLVGIPPHHPVF
jgi:hypothetical protein